MNDEVEIVVKMPGSGDYLPATLLRSDTSRDIALLRVTKPLFSFTLTFKKLLQYLSHRMFTARAWIIKYRRKEKLIA